MSTEKYPLPSYAASIWTAGDTIYLSLPPTFGTESGHTVHFPLSPSGWIAVNSILKAREAAERSARTIGNKAAPVQYDIDKVLMSLAKTQARVEKLSPDPRLRRDAPPDLTLEDLGL